MNGELSFLSRCRISGSLNRRLSMSTSPSTSCRLRSPASHSRKRSTGSPDGSTGSTIISTSFAMTLHLQSADDFRTAGPHCEHGNCVCGRTHCHGRVDAKPDVVPKSLYLREDFGQRTRTHSFPGNTLVEPLDQGKASTTAAHRKLREVRHAQSGQTTVQNSGVRRRRSLLSVLPSGCWKIHLTQRRPEKHAEGDRRVDHRHRHDRHGDAQTLDGEPGQRVSYWDASHGQRLERPENWLFGSEHG